jgi:hypothetical protein
VLLDLSDHLEEVGDLVEALFPGVLLELDVHLGVLVVLSVGSILQVVLSGYS